MTGFLPSPWGCFPCVSAGCSSVAPDSGDMNFGTMRGILVAGVIMALAIAAVESLNCNQCDSATNSCVNVSESECPQNSESCIRSLTSSVLGNTTMSNQKMSCSASNCTGHNDTLVAFTVQVSDGEFFRFEGQCCQGKNCNDTSNDPATPDASRNTECPACYGYNITSCTEKTQKCNKEERCVSLTADITNGTHSMLLVKGCSNISNSTCQFLAAENQTVGDVFFLKVECTEAAISPTPKPTSSSPGLTVSMALLSFASLFLLLLLL
ncbi:ly6/PLAUR domain-containing protein 8-like [Perognathus longimembris pacificus]|uniref:ly6/PLAUR domain-containing protein 8-like n=1 Tax=Perognathus longimembris pacificus TaxID=214514 RepID=UPI002018A627|nr:ly6/PLAUR domain-containing protein 8-like [Perognathus longimembris pacificus]